MFELLEISEWIIPEYGNWKLKENAPKHAKEIFDKYQKNYEKARKAGKIVE